MIFKKNTAVTGFNFILVNRSNGNEVTSGTTTGYVVKDGVTPGTTLTNTPTYDSGSHSWVVTITAAEMNADVIGLSFINTTATPLHFTILTDTYKTADLPLANSTAILVTPANKLLTDGSGRVTIISNLDKTGYSLSSASITNATFATDAINANAFAQSAADKVWSTTTRQLTGTQTFNLTGNITGNLTGSVGSIASGGITSASFATGAITSTAFAANALDAVWTTTTRTITGGTVTTVTNDVGITQVGADRVWNTTSRTLTSYSGIETSVWNALTSGMITSGSIGKKLADWTLGSDNRVLVSANAHTAGITVAAVTGNVGGNVVGTVASVIGNVGGNVVGSVASVTGNVLGYVGSINTGGISSTSFVAGAITSSVLAASAITSSILATGAITSTVLAGNCITASKIAANAITSSTFASNAIDAASLATDAVNEIRDAIWAATTKDVTSVATVTNPVTVGTINSNVITASSIAANAIQASHINTDAAQKIANYTWDTTQATHTGIGTFGHYLDIGVSSRLASIDYTDVSDDVTILKYDNLAVYIDQINGSSGQVIGINGIPGNPSNNLIDALAMANVLNFKKFILLGQGTLVIDTTSDYSGWTFEGERSQLTVVFMTDGMGNGPTVNFSTFKNLILSGFQGGTDYIIAKDCMLAQLYNLKIQADGCVLVDDIHLDGNSPSAGGNRFFNCKASALSALGPINLYFDSTTETTVWFREFYGSLKIHNMKSFHSMAYDSHGGGVHVESSCTGGLIRLRGINIYSDLSGGAVTWDLEGNIYRPDLKKDTWDSLTSEMLVSASIGKKLSDWVIADLGSDSRALISADPHVSGISVTSVIGNISGSVNTVNNLGTNANNSIKADMAAELIAYDSSNGVAKETSLAALKFMSPFNVIAPNQIIIPEVGIQAYKFLIYYYDIEGKPFDPDINEIAIKAMDQGGEDENYLLYQDSILSTALVDSTTYLGYLDLVREDVGIYSFYLGIDSTNDDTQIIYDFSLAISASEYHYAYTHAILQGSLSSVDLTDNNANKIVIAKAVKEYNSSSITQGTGSIHKDIMDELDDIDTEADQILIDTAHLESDVHTILAKTNQLNFTGTDVKATLDGETVTASSVTDKIGYELTGTERALLSSSVWSSGSRTLSGFGSLTVDTATAVWAAGTRALTDKVNFALTSAYDSAKTSSSQTSVNNLQSDITSIKANTDQFGFTLGNVNATIGSQSVTIGTNNDKSGYSLTSGERSNISSAIWSELTFGMITTNSIGKKLADWDLGSDNKVLLSSNAQTGVTIPTVTNITNDVNITQLGADKVWNTLSRTITDGTVSSVINDVGITQAGAGKVWSSATRTLTNYGTLVSDIRTSIWSAPTRTLTAGTRDAAIDAIKAKTDLLGFDSTGYVYSHVMAGTSSVNPADIWTYSTRSLTDKVDFYLASSQSFNTIGSVGSVGTVGTVVDKSGYSLTAAYDSAKTASSQATVDAIKTVVDKVDTLLELDGIVYKFTVKALEQAPEDFTNTDRTELGAIKTVVDEIQVAQETGITVDTVIDGSVTFQDAIVKILSFSANDVVITGTDPKVAEFKNSDNTSVVMTHTMPLDGSGRTSS